MIAQGKKFTIRVLNKIIRLLESNDAPNIGTVSKEETKASIKKNNISDLKTEYCSGCGACVNVCSVNALQMGRDQDGYLQPILDTDKCMNCGKCLKICPVINTKKENASNPACYAMMADDAIRMKSSSGGAFTLLAKQVLEQNGYVCGVTLDDNFYVKYMIIDQEKDLEKLRGSKYVQADTNNIYIKVKELLENGKKVLFTGCPCQVAGLNGFLQKRYDSLVTVDLVCHGGPSQMVFDRYISEYYGKENLQTFKFRTKEFGYNSMNQTAYLKNGSSISGNISFDSYEKCMHSGLALKKICVECPFAEVPRQGDITIGDFWGISKFNPEFNDGKGTSVVLINNENGKCVWEEIKHKCILAESVPFDIARCNNRFGRYMKTPAGRNSFFNMLKGSSFEKSVDYALNRKFDVGVIGLWFGENYGSMATYYALHHTLTKMGLSVLMIDNCLRPNSENVNHRMHPRKMLQEFYDISVKYSIDDLKILNQYCDTFIVGSDQLWNVDLSRPYRWMYYLDFVDRTKKKVSVATSFGWEYHGTSEEKLISSHYLRQFDHISVRDMLSKEICNDFGVEATIICDPALFCDSTVYDIIANSTQLKEKQKYILAYILDTHEEIGRFLHEVALKMKCKVVVVLDMYKPLWQVRKENLKIEGYDDVEVLGDVDLSEWLNYYKHAEAIITDSFHGTIFSVIYQKPFITKTNKRRGKQRFIALAEMLGIESRLFDEFNKIKNPVELLHTFDYTSTNEKWEKAREYSFYWLKDALYASKNIHTKAIYEINIIEEKDV